MDILGSYMPTTQKTSRPDSFQVFIREAAAGASEQLSPWVEGLVSRSSHAAAIKGHLVSEVKQSSLDPILT